MAKVKYVTYEHDCVVRHEQYHYFCEGCGHIHAVSPTIHSFNGDYDRPTFRPSVLCNWNPEKICHAWVTDGKIQYLDDCFHHLKGQTIDLPEMNDDMK
jgi:hypothetical protein